jgi:hypothetical protein
MSFALCSHSTGTLTLERTGLRISFVGKADADRTILETARRLRFEGRWVFDSASALGGLYLGDDTGDALAADAREALAALLRTREGVTYRDGEPVGQVLTSGGLDTGPDRAPSIVWHAQAVGVLLELGYLPSAAALQPHLKALEKRLDPLNADDPDVSTSESMWYLRTRHVAWVLACLSEFHAQALPMDRLPADVVAAVDAYQTIVRTAFRYLVGTSRSCEWVAVRPEERYWSECWADERRQNLLNTVYASLAVCRACRHGFAVPRRSGWHGTFPVEHTIRQFFESVTVRATSDGPRTFLKGDWEEPWGRDVLPPGVVALIVIALTEYAHLLLEAAEPGSRTEGRARHASTTARRAAHDLISREEEWQGTVDAFSYQGVERQYWFVPTYSVALRALLESNAAPPYHKTVDTALRTVMRFSRNERSQVGVTFETWGDPTRADMDRLIPLDEVDTTWHASVRVDQIPPNQCPPTASSVHASVMALASYRRAAHFADPRSLHEALTSGHSYDDAPVSPFTSLVIAYSESGRRQRGRPQDFTLSLSVGDEYSETCSVGAGAVALLIGFLTLGQVANDDALAGAIGASCPPQLSLPRSAEAVRKQIAALNARLGVSLVVRTGSKPVQSHLAAQVLLHEASMPGTWLKSLKRARASDRAREASRPQSTG